MRDLNKHLREDLTWPCYELLEFTSMNSENDRKKPVLIRRRVIVLRFSYLE